MVQLMRFDDGVLSSNLSNVIQVGDFLVDFCECDRFMSEFLSVMTSSLIFANWVDSFRGFYRRNCETSDGRRSIRVRT